MWKFLIGIICLLLMQSKPGQYFLVGFRNRALVITEQVLAHVGLILSKGLCLLNAHSNSVEVWPLWKLTRRKNERLEKWQKMPVLCVDCPLQLDSTGRIIWNNCTKHEALFKSHLERVGTSHWCVSSSATVAVPGISLPWCHPKQKWGFSLRLTLPPSTQNAAEGDVIVLL